MRASLSLAVLSLSLQVVSCAGEDPAASSSTSGGTSTGTPPPPVCKADAACADTPETPLCDATSGVCVALPPANEIGYRDGSPGSVGLVTIYEPDKQREPVDLAFNPAKPTELWVVNRKDDSVTVIQNPGQTDVSWKRYHDPDAMHFMNTPPAMAFGAMTEAWGQTWATCGDSDNGGDDFVGPALFSADPAIFAKPTPGGLGSHLDMMHSTTFCRGIAHVEANIYWVFNSTKGALERYDFKVDHGPGNDDHSDGELLRYAPGSVAGIDGVPSHLVYNPDDEMLYVADTGNARIAKLDTKSGTVGKNFFGPEPLELRKNVDGAVVVDVVPPGTLTAPSGLELHDGLIYVTDNATSRFHAFDLSGQLIRSLDTGFPPGSLAGFTFGPDGKIYFVNILDSRVYRIEPH